MGCVAMATGLCETVLMRFIWSWTFFIIVSYTLTNSCDGIKDCRFTLAIYLWWILGCAVLPWQLVMIELEIAVLPLAGRYGGIWDVPFYLVDYYYEIWDCRFTLGNSIWWNLGCAILPWQFLSMEFGIAVSPRQLVTMEFGTAVLPWHEMCRFTLAILMMEFGIAIFPRHLIVMEVWIAVLPWQLFRVKFGIVVLPWQWIRMGFRKCRFETGNSWWWGSGFPLHFGNSLWRNLVLPFYLGSNWWWNLGLRRYPGNESICHLGCCEGFWSMHPVVPQRLALAAVRLTT